MKKNSILRLSMLKAAVFALFVLTSYQAKSQLYEVGNAVGIGESSPEYKLHVTSSMSCAGLFESTTSISKIRLRCSSTSGTESSVNTYGNNLVLCTGGYKRLDITSGGDVGIGTSSPKKLLHVDGDTYFKGHMFLHAYAGDGSSGTAYIQARDMSGSSDLNLQLRTQNNGNVVNAMRLQADGAVTIGGTSAVGGTELTVKGAVHIGASSTASHASQTGNYQLWVEKGIVSEDFSMADVANWSDFVFEEDYELPALSEVESFVKENKHLPDVPSEAAVKANGYSLHDMNVTLLQKVEELTLYIIKQQKQIDQLMEASKE